MFYNFNVDLYTKCTKIHVQFLYEIETIMEIISVDFYKICRVSLFGKVIVLLFCKNIHDEMK
jgi:hypothetical protein